MMKNTDLMIESGEVILVDDNDSLLINVADFLGLHYAKIHPFNDPLKALKFLNGEFLGVVVSDVKMPNLSGIQLLEQLKRLDADLPVILMTGHGEVSLAVQAFQEGGYDFIEKPFDPQRLLESINRAMEKRFLTLSQRKLRIALADKDSIESRLIGVSPAIKRLRREVLTIAQVDVPVLIHGETGSGKEVVANCLHDFSGRKNAQFVPLNCAAIPKDLFEAELFGHIKGAFSGANTKRIGKLEFADQGTIFLDEVESIPLEAQVKILRALSEARVEAIGSNLAKSIDVRVISATKVQLKDNPDFRQDLYFRLQVAELYIPPLRMRKEDVLMLFEHYAVSFAKSADIKWEGASQHLQRQLLSYDWPGNVRELINIATRSVIQNIHDLNDLFNSQDQGSVCLSGCSSLKKMMDEYEKSLLIESLRRHQGSVQSVLEDLGVERRTFNLKLKKHAIERSDYILL